MIVAELIGQLRQAGGEDLKVTTSEGDIVSVQHERGSNSLVLMLDPLSEFEEVDASAETQNDGPPEAA